MGITARSMALFIVVIFLVGTLVGSVLPEFGDVLALRLKLPPHFFNIWFFVLGWVCIGLALYFGYRSGR